jgi:DNA-binding HxlR family transcriptional regulator
MNENSQVVSVAEYNHRVLKKTLEIISGKWRLFIIFQLGEQTHRYGELRRMIPDISEKVLIQELKTLVALGVLVKKSYGEVPPRVEYGLSEKGRQILPLLIEIRNLGSIFMT